MILVKDRMVTCECGNVVSKSNLYKHKRIMDLLDTKV